tara:strand:+ start:36 stop:566 length:531 start_codon:yes stop_codon:yes gene_type:complete
MVFSLLGKYMNIIIYTVLILFALYFLLRFFAAINSKKISQGIRILLFIALIAIAVLFAVAGKFLLTLPLTIASLALLKLKGLSLFQLISLFRLIQTLRNSGRFSFDNKNISKSNTMSISEAYKILNLNPSQKITKEEVNKAYIKIQKKIHPDISPETARLSSIVNEAKDIVLNNLN